MMKEVKNLKRGQMYYIKKEEDMGKDTSENGRPVVILAVDNDLIARNNTITVANITRRPRYDMHAHITISSIGYRAVAILEQPITISPVRLENFIGTVTEEELHEINAATLRLNNIDISQTEEKYKKELAEKEEEISRLKERLQEQTSKPKSFWFRKLFSKETGREASDIAAP